MTRITLQPALSNLQAQSANLAPVARALPDILYIMGTGRSGTTILEILLANNPGAAGVGELKHIFRDAYLRDIRCACGRSGRQCELWSAVLRSTGWDRNDCVRFGKAIEKLESHARFPLVWAGLATSTAILLYRQASEALFSIVGAVEHSSVIIDSSKYAGRALMLSRLFPGRVKVLCVTRSAAGIMKAFETKNANAQWPKGCFAAAVYYLYVLFCMRLVKRRLRERCLAIRFEDLNRDPLTALTTIEAWSGYSLATARAKVSAGDWFETGHIVTGNRLCKRGRVKFEPASTETSAPRGIGARLLAPMLETYRKIMGF